MKKTQMVSAGIAFVLAINFSLHAQTTPLSIQSLRSASAGDWEAMLQTLAATTPLPTESVPPSGTFYSAQNPNWPPLPCNIHNVPVWNLGNDCYLLDDVDVDYSAPLKQTQSGMRMMGMESSDTSDSPTYTFPTNGLWLEIAGISNGTAWFNLHNATNQVYAILSQTDLTVPGWNIEQEVWPGTNQDVTPFTVPILDRTSMLFVRAQDWTGVDDNSDGIPNWWVWKYFGTLDLSATNLDSQGNTLLYDFQNGIDPNIISFSVSSTNQYANTSGAAVQVNVVAGVPSYFAVVLDDTNFTGATWNAYASSNITINLGTNQGWHDVWVGLRGLPPEAQQTWETVRLKLDLTPPLLVITNPTASLVTQPVIQLQGYSPESLASISYDLTNAAGLVTNLQAIVLNKNFDTNTWDYTTNYFQCFDVPLTNGLNIITLHATDWAGNVTTTNFSFTLDYSSKTNPPAIQLDWPQAGTQISGNSFTWHGRLDDPTAQVTAQIVDTNGVTTVVNGRVGRDGSFWIDGLPLSGGTNYLTLTVTDAAGNSSSTTIPVIQSSLALAITSADLSQAPWGVSGTISDPDYTVWVNGVQATNNGDGTWTVQNAHLSLDTPVVQARAIPNSDNGGNGSGSGYSGGGASANTSGTSNGGAGNPGSSQATDVEKELEWPDAQSYINLMQFVQDQLNLYADPSSSNCHYHTDCDWQELVGGNYKTLGGCPPEGYDTGFWLGGRWPDLGWGTYTYADGSTVSNSPPGSTVPLSIEGIPSGSYSFTYKYGGDTVIQKENTEFSYMLLTGGAPGSSGSELYGMTGWVYVLTYSDGLVRFPPEQAQIGSLGSLDTNGVLYVLLPVHSEIPVTLQVKASGSHYVVLQQTGYKLVSQCVANTPADDTRTTIGVGEKVICSMVPPLNVNWSASSGSIGTEFVSSILYTAPSNAADVTVTATIQGQSISIPFHVIEPSGYVSAIIASTENNGYYGAGNAGAGMYLYPVIIGPTNVSFGRVWVMEIGKVATNAMGYFANTNTWPADNLNHSTHGANIWRALNENNSIAAMDHASSGTCNPPWSSGSFTWPIPVGWRVGNSPVTNIMSGWSQNFLIDASGTVTVQKFGHSVTRTTNDVITTQ